jgi:hypothetical protein
LGAKAPLWIYNGGAFKWGGAWGDAPIDYSSSDVPSVTGTSRVMRMASVSRWEYWLPYPPTVSRGASSQPPNSFATGGNGIAFHTAGYNYLTISIWPTHPGAQVSAGFYEAHGTSTDMQIPGAGSVMSYGPSTMTVGAWNTYKIPLTALGLPAEGRWIYKIIVQQQGNTPQVWYIDRVGFTSD